MAKKKYYVVWKGQNPGIYDSWTACQLQIKGYPGAAYKGYPDLASAKSAFEHGPETVSRKTKATSASPRVAQANIIWESLSVDAACSGNPGPMEYQGVDTQDKTQIFHQKFELGTNNIGEFLAIVHALALLKNEKSTKPIYTDSKIAQGWVKKKHCKTTLPRSARTKKLYELIDRAEAWLKANTYQTDILKWETKSWGEIPADFGRK